MPAHAPSPLSPHSEGPGDAEVAAMLSPLRPPSEALTEGLEEEETVAACAAKIAGGDWGPVFVYGMLLAAPAWGRLIGRVPDMRTAMVKGFERRAVFGAGFAGLMKKDDGITVGMCVTGLRPWERRQMDAVVDDGFQLITARFKYCDVSVSEWYDCTTYLWREKMKDALEDAGVVFSLPVRNVDFRILASEASLAVSCGRQIQEVVALCAGADIEPEYVQAEFEPGKPVKVTVGCPGGITMANDLEVKLDGLEKMPLYVEARLKQVKGIDKVVTKGKEIKCHPIADLLVTGDWNYEVFEKAMLDDFITMCADMREQYRCFKASDDDLKQLAMVRRRRQAKDPDAED